MKNQKLKLILFVVTSILLMACSGMGKRDVASTNRPRHVVFLVHGITADEKTFGHMKEALSKHLNTDDRYEYVVKNFVYETIHNKKDTELFAKDLGKSINEYFSENGDITTEDKISIVAHSQGGIISLIWIYRAMLGDADFNPQYVKKMDAFITLGTPYWGAKIAAFGSTIKRGIGKVRDDLLPFFGDQQLNDMSFGSRVIFNFRRASISPDFQETLKKMNVKIRPVNFGGAATSMKFLAPLASGLKEYEDDTAVPIPSSRYDFLFLSSLKPNYANGEVTPVSEFGETHFSKYHVVDALHVSLMPAVPLWAAIANIPERCVEKEDCNHPTFKYVVDHLKNLPINPDENMLKKMTSYLVDLNVKLPEGDNLSADKISVKFSTTDKNVKLNSSMELYSHGSSSDVANDVANKDYRHFYFMGAIANAFIPLEKREEGGAPFKDTVITMTVSSPGYKTRVIQTKVRPTFSTFVEINLEKE